jgi:RNA polymerase-binding protein DksA
MDLPTQTHLKSLRDLLTYRLAELRADVHAAEQERRVGAAEGAQEVADWKDEVTRGQQAALSGQQEERDRREMGQVEAALRRLDTGTYGDCEGCGEPIPLPRLLVQPAATRCAACQAKLEAKPSQTS